MIKDIASRIKNLPSAFSPLTEGSDRRDGRKAVLLLVIAALYVLIIPFFILEGASRSEVSAAKAKLKEMSAVTTEYKSLKERTDALEQRKARSKVKGIPEAMDEISSSLGLKKKIREMKAMGKREIAGGTEETEEVQIEGVTMNELVNILYTIEDAPMMLSLRRVTMKKTFENPELLNATLVLSFFTRT